MKKSISILILLFGIIPSLLAEHIKGGEMYYTFEGFDSTTNVARYTVTLKLYIDCNANNPGQLDVQVPFTIFDKSNNQQVGSPIIAPMTNEQFIRFDPASNPCISNAPSDVCYRIRWFSTTISLKVSAKGYLISFQRCCRINNINNLVAPSNASGVTYLCEIPGTDVGADAYRNNSPQYVTNDAAAICIGSNFTFSFAADEKDGDSLVYYLCNGLLGGSQADPAPGNAAAPPYASLNYRSPYSGAFPLGLNANIDSKTGLITGTAPNVLGQFVITACTYEYRKGVLINIHRKDIHVAVSDCIPLKAFLKPDYSYCDDFLVDFRNGQVNPAGSVYIWNYGDGSKLDSTNDAEGHVTHQYADTGTYRVRLKVILAGQCIDSTVTLAKVYPGFYPDFNSIGTCVLLPLQFTDNTTSRYGTASKWSWNFGDETTLADTSSQKNPSWKYGTTGTKSVQLIVESNKGCIDTITKSVDVRDKPPIALAFRDTLICSIDTLMLNASGNGIFAWSPNYNLINPGSPTPLVFPKQSTWYNVALNENGCVNKDSVHVRVVDFVTLDAGPDTTICLTDSVTLHPSTDGLYFTWSPAATLNDPTLKNPIAFPAGNTAYTLIAHIGKCSASDVVNIRTIPYPGSFAGPDTTICYQDTAQLHGQIVGSSFSWSPPTSLSSTIVLDPLAYPPTSRTYTLQVYDTLGCPKPGLSVVTVNVRPQIFAFAGNDTAIVLDQPLQLNGTGADLIQWTPPTYLNNPEIPNPVALLPDNFSYVMRAYTPEGCFDLDTINIKVFKTKPDIFVPNAFAPNGRNRVLRPIPVGISVLDYFRVYNRWGQLVFQTTRAGEGWDGSINGRQQDSGTYVWMVRGTDFTGKVIFRKGTAVLIR